ncbi:MAG: hypothetical protein ABI551_13390, partial [Polyangiaceae bacterium]
GLAVAALWDLGERDAARSMADELIASKHVSNVAWGALVKAASSDRRAPASGPQPFHSIITESRYRWIQWGWVE